MSVPSAKVPVKGAPAIVPLKDVNLPLREDLLRAMKLAENSPEAAQYLRQRVHEIVERSRFINKSPEAMHAAQQILDAVDEFAELVTYKFPQDGQAWTGKLPSSSSVESMHSGITQQAVNKLSEKKLPGIRFDYAISEIGHFVRGYASTEKGASQLDETTVDSLDRLFNAWLANKHGVATRDGNFFKMNAEGHIDESKKMTAAEVEELLADSAQDFKDYLVESKFNTEIVSRQRDYPGEHRLEEARKKAMDKILQGVEEKLEEKVEEKVEDRVEPTSMGGRT